MTANEQNRGGARPDNSGARRGLGAGDWARVLGYGLGVALFFIVLSEVVERTWLTGVEVQVLHLLHMAWTVVASLVVVVVVGRVILKASPPLWALAPANEEPSYRARLNDVDRAKAYAQWFIGMRWIAVLVAGLLVLLTVKLMGWLPTGVWRPLILTVLVLAGFNAGCWLLVRRNRGVIALLGVQGYVDLAILTVLLQFSGGIENPLFMMMVFHVIIGGMLLSRRQCYGIAAAGSLLFGLLIWGEYADFLPHHTLQIYPHALRGGELFHPAHHALYVIACGGLLPVILFLTAYFVTTLAERLRHNERRTQAMAERALAARQLLERALETTGAGVRVLDSQVRPHWVSTHWQEWFACRPGECCPGCASLDQEDSPARHCLQDGQVRVTELALDPTNCPPRLLPPGVGKRTFQVTTAPLFDLDGKITQVVELAQDVTEQKRAQEQVMRAGKLAAMGELAGQVAHEVNNPISIISAKVRLLLRAHRPNLQPKVAEELDKITDLADRVARVAQGLLSYCRPSAATRLPLDLRVPIRKSLAILDEQRRRNGVHIDDQLPESLPPVRANPQELEQVFLNLFQNALDAMPKGGWLNISAAPGDARLPEGRPAVAVVVADTGSGIPDEIKDKIFEPFFTTKEAGHGTGLGLAICLGVVRSHAGELTIESKVWQGTRVTVTLPVDAPTVKENCCHG